MPKKGVRNKRTKSRMSTVATSRRGRLHSVKDLIRTSVPALTRITDQGGRESFWRQWLRARLPEELRDAVSAVIEREGTLVVCAHSAAWSARLRFALQELEGDMRSGAYGEITTISVRVLPPR